jgi:predicted ATP-dependent serine protease
LQSEIGSGPDQTRIRRNSRVEKEGDIGKRKRRLVGWLWNGVVPIGKLMLIAGEPGVGKSLVTLDLAARVANGGRFPGAAA